jgi:large subunit ribosomal protein L4
MPKQMRRAAIRNALSTLVVDDQLIIVDKLELDNAKTKEMRKVLDTLAGGQSVLVLLAGENAPLERSISNLADARYLRASYLNIRDLFSFDKVVMPLDALEVIKGIWGK